MHPKINTFFNNEWTKSIACSLIASLIFNTFERLFIGIKSNLLIYIAYFVLLSILFYVIFKKEESKISDKHKVHKYRKRLRKISFFSVIAISILLFLSFFNFYQLIYYKATTCATPQGKIGIWVAKYSGGKDIDFDPKGLIQKLRFFLNKNQFLSKYVEVNELPFEITGKNEKEKEKEARKYGSKYNASVIVWGSVASEFKAKEELFLHIGLTEKVRYSFFMPEHHNLTKIEFDIKGSFLKNITQPLEILSEDIINKEKINFDANPSLTLLPKRIKEPLRIAKFLIALSLIWTDHCAIAKENINDIINNKEIAIFFDLADVYYFLAQSSFCLFYHNKNIDDLNYAINIYEKVLELSNKKEKSFVYSLAEYNNGIAHIELAKNGIEQVKNCRIGIEKLNSAVKLIELESTNYPIYITLALAHVYGAAFGMSPNSNLEQAIAYSQKAIEALYQINEAYKYDLIFGLKMFLGSLYASKAGYEDKRSNYGTAKDEIEEAIEISKANKNWNGYVLSLSFLSLMEFELIKSSSNKDDIFNKVETNIEKILNIVIEHKAYENSLYIGRIYLALAENGRNIEKNYNLAIKIFETADKVINPEIDKYKLTKVNFLKAKAYIGLAEFGVLTNIQDAINILERIVEKEKVSLTYLDQSDVLNQLGRAYLHSVNLSVEKKLKTIQVIRAKEKFKEALSIDHKNYAAINNYGVSCLLLADLGIDIEINLFQAQQNLEKIIKIRSSESDRLKYANALSDIGACHFLLAANDINISINIDKSINYLKEASDILTEINNNYHFIANQIRLGKAYAISAKCNKDVEDLKLANDHLTEVMSRSIDAGYSNLTKNAIQEAKKVLCLNIKMNFQAEASKKDIERINKTFKPFGIEIKCN